MTRLPNKAARFVCLLALALIVDTGCTTKSKAKAEAKSAYMAGQQQGMMETQDLQRTSVRFIGNVKRQFIEWNSTLTLTEAILVAEYQGRNPTQIIIIRRGQPMFVDPQQLLGGEDVPLLPGDTVEIRP